MRSIFLAIPTLDGKCAAGTELAIQFMAMEAECCGWKFQQLRWMQDSLIAHARNVCVAKFLQTDCTDLVFLDSDVAFGPGVFTRLVSHAPEMVAGVYRTKCDTERYPVHPLPEGAVQDQDTGLLEVANVPFGLVRIRREAIEKMVQKHADEWFTANDADQTKCVALFNTEIVNHVFWGEDFYFCRRWREMGGRIFVDPEFHVAHVNGEGKAYAGHFGSWLRAQGTKLKAVA